jgi:2-desacetyl-2-hydroxyethyl bacteriochlorophyllide A dehydrogenase
MRAAVTLEPRTLNVRQSPEPAVEPDEVLVKVAYAGICGTDLHIFHGTSAGVTYPIIQGHEFSGEVAAVGAHVNDVAVGAPVVAEGRAGTGFRRDGAFAEYLSVPREMLHVLPSDIDLFQATLVDPLACAINAVRRAQLKPTDHLVIVGQGSSGLCMLQSARALVGCAVAVVDQRPERLRLSERFGASLVVDPARTEPSAALANWAGEAGVDCVIDATGNADAVDLELRVVRRDGRIVVYGVFGQPIQFNIDQVVYKQVTLAGAVGSGGCWSEAIRLVAEHKVELSPIISRTVRLEDLGEALEALEAGRSDIKIVVEPGSSR